MKYIAHVFLLLVGLGAAFLRWVDLVNFTDLETGFPLAGSVWLRYGAIFALVLLASLASLMAARRPAKLEGTGGGAGVLLLVLGVLCAGYHTVSLWLALDFASLLQGSIAAAAWYAAADIASALVALLGLLCAAWLLCVGQALLGRTYRLPAGGIALGMLGNVYLYAMLISRFSANQSSYYRLDPTVSVFAAAAAIWFFTALLRSIYYPQSGIGRRVYRAGLACFYLCTCFALPQGICDFMVGNITVGSFAEVVLFACFGVLGAFFAHRALSEELA